MKTRKAIIHIGPVKTGSSTIQTFLLRNYNVLKAKGVHLPLTGDTGHWRDLFVLPLVNACLDIPPATPWKYDWRSLTRKGLTSLNRKKNQRKLERILSSCLYSPISIFTFECFSEMCLDSIAQMKKHLDTCFQEYTVITYLRRQPELFASWYSQVIQSGVYPFDGTFDEFISSYFYDENSRFDNYWSMLERWSNVFGKDNVKPRIFDRKEMVQNDLLDDFSAIAGIDMNGLIRVEPQQVSIDPETTEFMRLLSLYFPMRYDQSLLSRLQLSDNVILKLFSRPGNVGYRLNRSQASAILNKYRDSNNTVAKEYFGHETLFSDDLSAYPEETLPHHLTLEKAAEISAAIIEELYGELENKNKGFLSRLQRLCRRIKKLPQKIQGYLNSTLANFLR